MIDLVRLDQVDSVWPRVLPWIEEAICKAHSLRKAMDLYKQCRNGSYFLAVATPSDGAEQSVDDICGVVILAIEDDGDERYLQHVIVASDPMNSRVLNKRWVSELIRWPLIGEWGITDTVSEGREGWPEWVKDIVPTLRVVRVVMTWKQSDVVDPATAR